jgi:hypothetical protein
LGAGIKCVYPSELKALQKLRRVKTPLSPRIHDDQSYLIEQAQEQSGRQQPQDLAVTYSANDR